MWGCRLTRLDPRTIARRTSAARTASLVLEYGVRLAVSPPDGSRDHQGQRGEHRSCAGVACLWPDPCFAVFPEEVLAAQERESSYSSAAPIFGSSSNDP